MTLNSLTRKKNFIQMIQIFITKFLLSLMSICYILKGVISEYRITIKVVHFYGIIGSMEKNSI